MSKKEYYASSLKGLKLTIKKVKVKNITILNVWSTDWTHQDKQQRARWLLWRSEEINFVAFRDLLMFAQFRKTWKTPMKECYFQWSCRLFNKSTTPPSVFFTFLKLNYGTKLHKASKLKITKTHQVTSFS